ncbi:MAG: hypothetical protein ACFE9X_05900 [Promethearchaeota archaeon]
MIAFLNTLNINQNSNQSYNEKEQLFSEDLKTQALTTDNIFSGNGAPWNVTHYANRTKTNLAVSFYNNSYDNTNAKVELYGWNGYQLNSTVKDLYDTRNWINGTFHAGTDNGPGANDNDSLDVANWTFDEGDIGHDNDFSGNYYDGVGDGTDGADCLELRVGDESGEYDVGDKCWWETTFELDRGDVDEAWLSFAAFPKYSDQYNNHFVLQTIINDKTLWGNGLASMLDACGNPSGQWYNPQPIFLDVNDEQIFPVGVKSMNITLEFKRVSGHEDPGYSTAYSVLIDNVSLVVKAKTKPSQLDLQLNGEDVNDNANYGEGNVGIMGNWNGSIQSSVIANFSSNLNWPLTFEEDGSWISYKIDLDANLNLFANKYTPESYYAADPDLDYQGSAFSVSNNSNVDWTTYAHMEIPAEYEETNMTVEYPSDYNLIGVSFSQNPNSISQTTITEYGNKKVVNIPVSSITNNTNGFWKLTAVSPNYCSELDVYKGSTATGPWVLNNSFMSGDYINITGEIVSPQLDISSYIGSTNATLYLRFPDGTIWTGEYQNKQVNDNGIVYFDPFMIPNNVPNYKAGEYEVVITWNNSYSSFQSNETGIIYQKFAVIHDSKLEPDQGIYFIENVIDDSEVNIYVSFRDLIDDTAIDDGLVYTNFAGEDHNFTKTSPGFYLFIFNASKASAGNNTLTIYANSTYHLNKVINITVDVVKETLLTVEDNFFSVPWKQNFTLQFNFTEKNNPGIGIDAVGDISISWLGDYYLNQPVVGQYELQCNTSAYTSETIPSFIISINKYKYEAQSVIIRVYITELASSLNLFLNGEEKGNNDKISVNLDAIINVTITFTDNLTGTHLSNASVNLSGIGDFNETNNYYNYSIKAIDLGYGTTQFSVFAEVPNYQPQSIVFWIEVSRIVGNISRADGGDQIEVYVGEDVSLNIILKDPLNNTIKNANVTFTWAYGQGELEDLDNDGIYNAILPNVRKGVHEIRINAISGEYNFKEYKITLIVSTPSTTAGPDLSWLIYALIGGIIVLITVFTLYQTHYKYPPMVRKIRKLKKKVRKTKKTKPILVPKRDDIIETNFQNQVKILDLDLIQTEKADKIEKIFIKKEGED